MFRKKILRGITLAIFTVALVACGHTRPTQPVEGWQAGDPFIDVTDARVRMPWGETFLWVTLRKYDGAASGHQLTKAELIYDQSGKVVMATINDVKSGEQLVLENFAGPALSSVLGGLMVSVNPVANATSISVANAGVDLSSRNVDPMVHLKVANSNLHDRLVRGERVVVDLYLSPELLASLDTLVQ